MHTGSAKRPCEIRMRVRILGSAAGGGLPQWNCRCANCEAVRAGSPDVQPRTQSSVAVSADNRVWFLLNVSADVRQQLLAFAELWPPKPNRRGTTIGGCVLTDAEIDHTSGLLQLREGCHFGIFSTELVHRWLSSHFPIGTILAHFADRPWAHLTLNDELELPLPDGNPSGLRVRAFETAQDAPCFVPGENADLTGGVIGLEITDSVTGGKLVYAPGVAAISETLRDAVRGASCILMDGTFWSDDEPIQTGISDETASQMGHVPVQGPTGSLRWLTDLPVRRRILVHINNTNPMLDESGPEWRIVTECGVRVGVDGDEFEL
ncbi:MAG: pyrroloquinoline quinone biosynthesis protein PqqB [Planctomycetaceae bacterium]|nr:pyrroloquinoline quinone biosynthesis protein PqqB [Planctomycetaceae bacterium]